MSGDVNTTPERPAATAPDGPDHRSLRRHWPIALVALALVAASVLVGAALGHSRSSAPGTISVTGSGVVQATPDTMSFSIGVQTTAQSAAGALSANNIRVGALEAILLGHGVKKSDLQTAGLNIYQNTNNNGMVTGFSVSNELNVTMHLSKSTNAGAVIDAAARAAGNGVQLYGVSFSISHQSALLASARVKAMRNARAEATQLALGGGARIGGIVKVIDQENASPPPVYYGLAAPTAAKSSGVPIQQGSQSITVQVSVVFAFS
jgi:uncharacterized protein YggE